MNARFSHPRCLPTKQNTAPVLPQEGDEVYAVGVMSLNISALLYWLENTPQPIINMPIHIWGSFPYKENHYVDTSDISRPIIVAEIAPDYKDFVPDVPEADWISRGYVCIDGQHRLEKARRLRIETLPAVVLRMEQHAPFICEGYERYAEYWNQELMDRTAGTY